MGLFKERGDRPGLLGGRDGSFDEKDVERHGRSKSTYARIRAGRDGLKRRNHLGTLRILR